MLIFGTSLLGITFFTVIHNSLKDVPSVMNFFSRANVYHNMSTLVKLRIQDSYPLLVQNNFLLSGLANKAVDLAVTPTLVEKATKPALTAAFAVSKTPTSIINDKIILSTDPYKKEAINTLTQLDLPKFILVNANFLVEAIPNQIALVDLEKRPNSLLGMIIKLRTLFQMNQQALTVSWVVMWISLVVLILHGLRHLKQLFKTLWVGFLIVGGLVVGLSLVSPWLINGLLPSGGDSLVNAQNSLVKDIVVYLFSEMRDIAIFYLGVTVLAFIIWRFIKLDKLQLKVDQFLKRVHIPTISVKVNT
jgi:hypothetical protein